MSFAPCCLLSRVKQSPRDCCPVFIRRDTSTQPCIVSSSSWHRCDVFYTISDVSRLLNIVLGTGRAGEVQFVHHCGWDWSSWEGRWKMKDGRMLTVRWNQTHLYHLVDVKSFWAAGLVSSRSQHLIPCSMLHQFDGVNLSRSPTSAPFYCSSTCSAAVLCVSNQLCLAQCVRDLFVFSNDRHSGV